MTQVTVAIPTYNRLDFLGEAIDSVLQQTFQDFQVLVCDNCSTEDTEGLVRSFKDPRIQFERNPQNLGQFGNITRSIELTGTPFWALLMDDDLWHPLFLETAIAGFQAFPQAQLSTTPVYLGPDVDDLWNCPIQRPMVFAAGFRGTHQFLTPEEGLMLHLLTFPFHPSAFVGRTQTLKRFLPLCGRENWGGDYLLSAQCSMAGGLAVAPLPLVFARVHPGTETARTGRDLARRQVVRELQEQIIGEAEQVLGLDAVERLRTLVEELSVSQVRTLRRATRDYPRTQALVPIYHRILERSLALPRGTGATVCCAERILRHLYARLRRLVGSLLRT